VAAQVAKLVLGVHLGSPFGRRGDCKGSVMVLFERATIRLSIVIIVLYLIIWPQIAIKHL